MDKAQEVIEYWENTWKTYAFHPMSNAPSQRLFLDVIQSTIDLLKLFTSINEDDFLAIHGLLKPQAKIYSSTDEGVRGKIASQIMKSFEILYNGNSMEGIESELNPTGSIFAHKLADSILALIKEKGYVKLGSDSLELLVDKEKEKEQATADAKKEGMREVVDFLRQEVPDIYASLMDWSVWQAKIKEIED